MEIKGVLGKIIMPKFWIKYILRKMPNKLMENMKNFKDLKMTMKRRSILVRES
jgi:hypothetical protein